MGIPAGNLDNLMNPLASTSLIEELSIPVYSRSLEAKFEKIMFPKLVYMAEIFVKASSAIKPAI